MSEETYATICLAETKEECIEAFEKLLMQLVEKHGGTREDYRNMQLSNVGYCTGYYSREVAENVQRWLGCSHPVFGNTWPTSGEAFQAGVEMALKERENG